MKLYSYIVTHDTGFAPNPFWGVCTLACCKPAIRRSIGRKFSKQEQVWVVGLSPKTKRKEESGNRIVFAMRVTEQPLTFKDYFYDRRFRNKQPNFNRLEKWEVGDNIYKPIERGMYEQLRSRHSKDFRSRDWRTNKRHKQHDLGGKYVLVSSEFYYFGAESRKLPRNLYPLKVTRGHRCRFSEPIKQRFLEFVAGQSKGVNALPTHWHSVKSREECS